MKNHLGLAFIALSLFLLSFTNFFTVDEVATAIRAGNISQLSGYLDNRVDITMPDKSDTYSKSQAAMIISDFFSNNEVQNFKVKHRGENSGTEFCIGILQTRNGNFQTTFFMKQKGDKQLLQELRFQIVE
jgi:hypothetical protein